MSTHLTDDAFASILVDIARSAEVAPRLLPEDFGPGGRYRLEELIGIGHDSHVYRAVDRHLSKPSTPAQVVVKIRASGASARAEALVGRSVVHENVVRIIDHGVTEEGESYLVQEWVAGGDLTGLALPIPAREAARLVAEVARGVQALHSAGNVHGDLKPSNILRTEGGTPKITDFDLASAPDLDLSSAGGNLALIAPERLLGGSPHASPLSDIYSLGGLLYYFLTGRPPHGEKPDEILSRLRFGAPVSLQGIEVDLARICARALAREPDDRYRSAEALAADLELWLARRPIPWMRPSALRRAGLVVRRRPLQVLIALLVIATSGAALGWVQVSIHREIDARRRSVDIAAEEVERTREDMRAKIRGLAQWASRMRSSGSSSGVFPVLVWVDWLGETDLFGDAGAVMAREARLEALTQLRKHYRKGGQTGSLSDAMAAYCLAFLHLEAGQLDVAGACLDDAEAGVFSALSSEDAARRSLQTMRKVLEFERAVAAGHGSEAARLWEELAREREELLALNGMDSMLGLIRLVFERHREFQGEGTPPVSASAPAGRG